LRSGNQSVKAGKDYPKREGDAHYARYPFFPALLLEGKMTDVEFKDKLIEALNKIIVELIKIEEAIRDTTKG